MKIIYVSSLVSNSKIRYIIDNSNQKPLQSIQRYHRLVCEGLVNNDCEVKTISAIPMSDKISNQKIWFEKKEVENRVNYQYIPFINLPIFRQLCLLLFTILLVLKEIIFSKEKPIFICDILNTTISSTTWIICKLFGIKCSAIVTDLPKDMTGSNKLSVIINKFFETKYDYYILLTLQMNKVVNPYKKPYIILEGICDKLTLNENKSKEKYIMYAGGLKEEYGLKYLIEGFKEANIPDLKLYIYGTGEMEEYLNNLNDKNIVYKGVLKNDEVIKEEQNATLLVNPRFSKEEYTKYSFPSKNMEYMSTGTPVLTTKLRGIPKEYNNYTYIIDEESPKGIKRKLKEIIKKSKEELKIFGEKARNFVLENKNKSVQAEKIVKMLNENKEEHKYKKNKLFKIYGFILLFLTIILSRNTLISNNLFGFYKSTILLMLVFIPLMIMYFYNKVYKKMDLIFIIILLSIGFSIILKGDIQLYNLSVLAYLIIAYIFIKMYELKDIIKWYIIILLFLSLYSLLFIYIIYPMLVSSFGIHKLLNFSNFFYNSISTPFLNFGFAFPVVIQGYVRNFGIFTEPGIYQFYLLVALLISGYSNVTLNKKIRKFLIFIFGLTLITTFSSSGYLCLLILSSYYIINYYLKIKNNLTKKQKEIIWGIFILLLIVFVLYVIFINNTFTSMIKAVIIKFFSSNESTNVRLYSVIYTLKLFFTSILVGNKLSLVLDNSVIITNTNITFLAVYGLIAGLCLLILHYRFSEKLSINRKEIFIIFILTLLSVNNHMFIGAQSFWLLMMIGLKEKE